MALKSLQEQRRVEEREKDELRRTDRTVASRANLLFCDVCASKEADQFDISGEYIRAG